MVAPRARDGREEHERHLSRDTRERPSGEEGGACAARESVRPSTPPASPCGTEEGPRLITRRVAARCGARGARGAPSPARRR
eukprot:4862011-Prymnesium_polylepis.1